MVQNGLQHCSRRHSARRASAPAPGGGRGGRRRGGSAPSAAAPHSPPRVFGKRRSGGRGAVGLPPCGGRRGAAFGQTGRERNQR
ncbi:hypothetical protein Ga0080559_TMP1710 [Salipiger profundus]|uniref:Uncharacterized protein n=1 Tax=Salipiger profundus TaxID=1229727 RepID=A0A1U7D358_9RHOB|nr:hypothetical protein Ga0080559_TMP1710 [Salipiger profundus]